jgi:hypothetical protein
VLGDGFRLEPAKDIAGVLSWPLKLHILVELSHGKAKAEITSGMLVWPYLLIPKSQRQSGFFGMYYGSYHHVPDGTNEHNGTCNR